MATIHDILQLDLTKIEKPALTETLTEIIEGYKNADDKKDFLAVFQPNIDKAYLLVSKFTPEAIDNKQQTPCSTAPKKEITLGNTPVSSEKKKKKKGKAKPEEQAKPKLSSAQYQGLRKQINDKLESCRRMIRQDNKEKRALLPPKRPQSTYEKVQKKILSLGKLIPSNLKNNLEVQRETKKIMMRTHKDILKAWRMNSITKLEKDQQEIQQNYQKIEEKIKAE